MKNIRIFIIGTSLMLALWLAASFQANFGSQELKDQPSHVQRPAAQESGDPAASDMETGESEPANQPASVELTEPVATVE
ncbi:hypothetical protein HW115_06630 [Verrucomicrobiaceae bacterium N1E253]|uniref:Uncharacterized protein n=1 Tax=Oceaniferula marina TaxID=2748318 RepID=A0A851GC14_9BACT|nr:hypothetical protein [Oceaniferula marina]NWK55278.1 hypothetical protein [Oceaniferula marina]